MSECQAKFSLHALTVEGCPCCTPCAICGHTLCAPQILIDPRDYERLDAKQNAQHKARLVCLRHYPPRWLFRMWTKRQQRIALAAIWLAATEGRGSRVEGREPEGTPDQQTTVESREPEQPAAKSPVFTTPCVTVGDVLSATGQEPEPPAPTQQLPEQRAGWTGRLAAFARSLLRALLGNLCSFFLSPHLKSPASKPAQAEKGAAVKTSTH
jgi:hypothetical protein